MTRAICSTGTKIRSPPANDELEVVALLPFPAATQHLLVARDAVIDVDDEVTRREPLEDVARDDPPERLRPADANGPEQLAVRHERETVRSTHEPAVEAAPDQRDRPGRWRLLDPLDDGDRVARLLEDLGQARRLVRGEHDAAALLSPAGDRLVEARRPTKRQHRLAPAEHVARALAARRHRHAGRWLGFPGQLEGPRPDQPALPVPRREVGRRPVLRSARRPPPARPAAHRPGATGTRRPRRDRPARRARGACPDPRDRARSRAPAGRPRPRPRRRRPSPGMRRPRPGGAGRPPSLRSGRGPSRAARRAATPPCRAARGSRPRPRSGAGTPTRAGGRSARPPRSSAGRSDRRPAASRSRHRRTRSGSGSSIDGGKTSTMPPRRANSPRPATSVTGE